MNESKNNRKKKSFSPHAYMILFFMFTVVAVLTHIIPSGSYDQVLDEATGRMIIDPNSFHYIENKTVSFMQWLTAIPRGFIAASSIIGMTMLCGSGFALLNEVGVIPKAVEVIARKFGHNRILIIPVLMIVFACIDTIIGMPELVIVYVAFLLPLMIRLGFDGITTLAVTNAASAAGFAAGLMNPYSTVIGQKLAGLPIYSGMWFRAIVLCTGTTIAIVYTMRYAKKQLANPLGSLSYETDAKWRNKYAVSEGSDPVMEKMTMQQKIVGIFVILMMILMVFGMLKLGWDLPEMGALFLMMGLGAALICRVELKRVFTVIVEGGKDMVFSCYILAMGRAVSIMMEDGEIADTIVHAMGSALIHWPKFLCVIGVLLCVLCVEIFIGSGSGKAVIFMPILSPLADVLGISRQTMVLAFQFGDGYFNETMPNAQLSFLEVDWTRWLKFYLPLVGIQLVHASVMLVIANAIHLGPF